MERVKQWLKKHGIAYAVLLALLICSAYFMEQHLTHGHDWGGDFALYLNQAEAIGKGELQSLYQSNQFTVDESDRLIGPYLYPMGYPILLSPIIALFGLNFYGLKVFTNLFFYAGLILLFNLLRPHFKQLFSPLLIITCLAFSEHFLFHGDMLLSDFPFFFFVMLSLSLFQKKPSVKRQIALAVIIFFAYLIRELGAMLLVALFTYQWQVLSSKELIRKYSLTYLVFMVLFFSAALLFPFGSKNHFSLLIQNASLESISTNFSYYLELLSLFLRKIDSYTWLPYLFGLLFLLGLLLQFKKQLHWLVFLLLSFGVLLLWPYQQGMRFLFASLPFILFFILIPLEKLPKWPKYAFAYSLLTLMTFEFLKESSIQNERNLSLETNQIYQAEPLALFEFVKENYTAEDSIVFFKPRVLRMLTGVKSLYIQPDSFMTSPYPILISSPWFPPRGIDSSLMIAHFGPYGVFEKP